MKNKLIIAIGLLTFSIGIFLAYNIIKKYNSKKAIALQKQTLPNFLLYNQEEKPFSAKDLKEDKPICIFYYNAECEHCQYEAKQISKNINAFKNTLVIMVSTNTPKETTAFAKTYKLDAAGFIWLYDKDYSFYKWFGKAVTPSVYIYNAQHRLIKEYAGEVKIDALIKYLDDDQ
ncbi:peroxiredoxin family protein [Pedobacter jeongneungensis]|uniref:peroxiredoxin family protein n=1 Tax=Pedobacter jeongneungensis TaxID=947309 RepID=UPI0004698485|nr:redoxin domain-containing protein [Pedobacter jeongneungensis]